MIPLYISDDLLLKQFSEASKEWKRVNRNGNIKDYAPWSKTMVLNLLRWKMSTIKKKLLAEKPDNADILALEIPENKFYEEV